MSGLSVAAYAIAYDYDEFIDVKMDASHILWIATANDETSIPDPVFNRMNAGSAAHDARSPCALTE